MTNPFAPCLEPTSTDSRCPQTCLTCSHRFIDANSQEQPSTPTQLKGGDENKMQQCCMYFLISSFVPAQLVEFPQLGSVVGSFLCASESETETKAAVAFWYFVVGLSLLNFATFLISSLSFMSKLH